MIPPCQKMGPQCRRLNVTLRVAVAEDGPASADPEATWLFGHTERIAFGKPWRHGIHLYARAKLFVPCRYLTETGAGPARCSAHGFSATLPEPAHRPAERHSGNGEFEYVHRGRMVRGPLKEAQPARRRALPVIGGENPCATARCRTADNRVGAACCRDLQLEVLCSPTNHRLESLLRSRKSPYLCKVDRDEEDSLGVEMISACSYLDRDGVSCVLHNRVRPDGRRAKPDLCFDWPSGEGVYHSGCVLAPLP